MRSEDFTQEAMLTVNGVAEELRVCARSVRRWIAAGELTAYRFGRAVRISRGDLDAFKRTSRAVS